MEERARKKRQQKARENIRLEKKRNRKKKLMIEAGVGVILAGCLIYTVVDKVLDKDTMGCRIKVYGQDVSWDTPEEAAEKIENRFLDTEIDFVENGKNVYQTTMGDLGYSLDDQYVLQELERVKAERKPCLGLLEWGKKREISYNLMEEQEKRQAALKAEKFGDPSKREPSQDAKIFYDEETGRYEIVNSSVGTQINEGKIVSVSDEVIKESLKENLLPKKIEIPVNTEVYIQPEVTEEDSALKKEKEEFNQKLDNYPKSKVVYTFGETTEEIDAAMIESWILKTSESISLDEEAMRDYIAQLSARYNTAYDMREFETSFGYTEYIDNNEYGYVIDQEAEYEQLCKDLQSGTEVKRDPIYSQEGYNRNGADDLMGNYVEVSIDSQYLWMYQNGDLVTETPVVTGQPVGINPQTGAQEDWSTYRGTYPLAYKESPAVLSSDIYGYEVDVQYWMPFVLGQGLHDADWNGAFGGNIYQYAGSHGCVNLPSDQAAVIYNYIEEGYPIIIY